eukprot:m.877289 g.877289  ORF g.877289 m.877289 type:complete len:653 (-) comp59827_c0_seq4:215-2173(-)
MVKYTVLELEELSADTVSRSSVDDDTRGEKAVEEESKPLPALLVEEKRPGKLREMRREMSALLSMAWPVSLAFLSRYMINVTSIIFAGHYLNPSEFDALGLTLSFVNVFGLSVGSGLAMAAETLGSQAFGANKKFLVGLTLQKGILVLALGMLPCIALQLNSERIFLACAIDPVVARLAGETTQLAWMAIPFFYLTRLLEKYLASQGVLKPMLYTGLIVNVINLLANYIFQAVLSLGLVGNICALLVANISQALLLFIYIRFFFDYRPTWEGWSVVALYDWGQYVSLALPGLLMLCVELWSFELCQLLSGQFGTDQLAAQLIIFQLIVACFMVPLGVSVAVSVRVGNTLGAVDPRQARTSSITAIFFDLCYACCVMLLLFFGRHVIPKIFTSDSAIADIVTQLLVILAVLQIFDGLQGTCSGILRGCGRQKLGATINVLGYIGCGVPLAVVLAFQQNLETQGLLFGLLAGVSIQALLMLLAISRTNWTLEACKAAERCDAEAARHESARKASVVEADAFQETRFDSSESDGTSQASMASDKLDEYPLARRNSRFSSSTKRIFRIRLLQSVFMLSILAVGVVVRVSLGHTEDFCYPLPSVNHSTSVCEGRASVLVSSNCSISCEEGFTPSGDFVCGRFSVLEFVPSCVQIQYT